MSRFQVAVLLATAATSLPGTVTADELLTGDVISAQSRWARGGTAIVTESLLRLDDGRQVLVRQLGGSVGGIGMVVLHGPVVLQVGDRVTARVSIGRDLGGRESRVVRALFAAGAGLAPFVRTVATNTRAPLAWESGCAIVTFQQAGTSHLPGKTEFTIMESSLARWLDVTADCSYLDLRMTEPREGEVGLDGVNLVVFRENRWCRPATANDPEECYDPDAAGLTTLFFIDDGGSDRNGAILDADIELNAIDFAISADDETEGPQDCLSDLDNTFTHEVGHLMGLDHTCFASGDRLVDDRGNPQPNCEPMSALSDEQREATMYAYQDCGEIKKTTAEPDDIDGVCSIYPLAADPGECGPPVLEDGGCCAVSGRHPSRPADRAGALLLLATLVTLGAARRRR